MCVRVGVGVCVHIGVQALVCVCARRCVFADVYVRRCVCA